MGQDIIVSADFCQDITDIVYVVESHSNIVHMERIHLPQDQRNKYTIHIKPTMAMVPSAYLFVYYESDGKIVYNDIKLKFPEEFENKVSL